MFSAFWNDAVNVTDRDAILQHLDSAGLDGNSILTKAEGEEYAKRLASNTQFAADRGVFGPPTFIVGSEIFFGNDRLDFLEATLKQSAQQK
jgi:2-hydroxychromene-2-carboxylate isomerase